MPRRKPPYAVAAQIVAERGGRMRLVSFRFSPSDLAALVAIQEHAGLGSKTDALRFAMRSCARAEGIELPPVKAWDSDRRVNKLVKESKR